MIVRLVIFLLALGSPAPADTVAEALTLASRERERAGMSALQTDPRLAAAAEAQARYMAARGQIGHDGPQGSSFADRLRGTGYRGCYGAENVAAGQRTPELVTESWMKSDGHRRNILDRRMTHGAVAAVRDDFGRLWWAMVLAGPC
ncbi:CAP domain-containing protein [Jannaschia rubra]|uniref:Cysteine-rich secretory protein family protein n=1 Tax=Jannaschia rubra TaxID=282197 RepID=A0A0M6XKM0_9RHOB|nr:CAP domain-containing protein [Jannaschia rubra]CTQ31639.1 Cysteine-rich secretory protein family protein [Jannaschia rubra]SFF75867.1 Cysteine-rich secretory protein family protein [Jannaschia rubra]